MTDKHERLKGPLLSRRAFAAALGGGASLAWSASLLARVPALAQSAGSHPGAARIPMAAVHDSVPYFDYTGFAEPYRPPRRNARTADYLKSLSQEEFLRRHYYY